MSKDDNIRYHSPLVKNATVTWERRFFDAHKTENSASVELTIGYPDVDWQFSQKIYGWSAFQFQTWVKGELYNSLSSKQKVLLYTDNILEFWINDEHFFGGDFYAFRRAPAVVYLLPGVNIISVRLVGDVRAVGGAFPPILRALVEVILISDDVRIDREGIMLPDVIDGHFCSPFGSLMVGNQADQWIKIQAVHLLNVPGRQNISILFDDDIWLAPGQTRPVRLRLEFEVGLLDSIQLALDFMAEGSGKQTSSFRIPLQHVDIHSVQKVTFLHSSGTVSYAILRPPSRSVTSIAGQKLRVLVNLHGAGVEADSAQVRASFDEVPDLPAWLLFPTGMSQWSSDDWHTWGFADVQAALLMIPQWIEKVNWTGPGVLVNKVLVTGHSNGGQGTWYYASHQPDRVFAAAAASGYLSIENYVPYALWTEADPLQSAILQSSRSNFRHELLVENLVGLSLFQQHGSADDNVPPYHSRLMNTLLTEAGQQVNYSELLNKGHWFDGAMTTPGLVEFYMSTLQSGDPSKLRPKQFTFIVPNSDDMGSRYGVFVDQLLSPDRLGKIEVTIEKSKNSTVWHLRTSNVHRLHIVHDQNLIDSADEIIIDGMMYPFELDSANNSTMFVKREPDLWSREVALDWRSEEQRYGRQRGSSDAILRTRAPFQLVYTSNGTLKHAVQASRNFLQYFGADAQVVSISEYENISYGQSNLITFLQGTAQSLSRTAQFPIEIRDESLVITTRGLERIRIPHASGLGGIWLRPLSDERLELVVWGFDSIGLDQATRLVPTLSGVGQPDFVILGNAARWKGHAGTLAMGFFDHAWKISSGSYLP